MSQKINLKNRIFALILTMTLTLGAGMGFALDSVAADTVSTKTVFVETAGKTTVKEDVDDITYTESALPGCPESVISDSLVQKMYCNGQQHSTYAKKTAINSSDWGQYASNYYYNQMPDAEKTIYNGLDEICREFLETKEEAQYSGELDAHYTQKAVIVSGISTQEAIDLYTVFKISNPQYYFLDGACLLGEYEGDVVLFPEIYEDLSDGSARFEESKKVKKKLDAILKNAEKKKTLARKMKYIHDYIVKNVSYDYEMADDVMNGKYHSQSIYSTLFTGKGICAGYTYEFEALCNALGIDTIPVVSDGHAWNQVRLYGIWYNVDCTFDDVLSADSVCYQFYCISDATLKDYDSNENEHTKSRILKNYKTPNCCKDSGSFLYFYSDPKKPSVRTQTPVVSVTQRTEENRFNVSIKVPDNSVVYYTTNGEKPNVNATKGTRVYKKEFSVAAGTTVKIVAVSNNKLDSEVKKMTLSPVSKVTSTATR